MGERLLLASLAVVCCSVIFLNYWKYGRGEPELTSSTLAILLGKADAPSQYRILVPWLAAQLRDFVPGFGWRHAFGLIDGAGLAIACLGLWLAHRELMEKEEFPPGPRLAAGAILAGVVAFNLLWLDWYQKVETVSTIAYVVWASLLLERTRPVRGASWLMPAAAVLTLTLGQALNRADAAAVLGLGFAMAALSSSGPDRWARAQLGLAIAATAGFVQLWLIFAIFPGASHGATPVIMLHRNLADGLPLATLFLLPVLLTLGVLVRQRRGLPGLGWATLLYLPVLFTVAQISEVRILIPFTVALAPFTASAIVRGLGFAKPGRSDT